MTKELSNIRVRKLVDILLLILKSSRFFLYGEFWANYNTTKLPIGDEMVNLLSITGILIKKSICKVESFHSPFHHRKAKFV